MAEGNLHAGFIRTKWEEVHITPSILISEFTVKVNYSNRTVTGEIGFSPKIQMVLREKELYSLSY